jgi:hypothetical protein
MPRIRPLKFVHIVYRTYRFDEMVAWYQKVLGAKVQHYDPASPSSPTTTSTTA